MVCTFAGHREVFGLGQSQVVEILERLLEAEQEMTCYVGGKGEFDAICASAVRTLKHRHPDKAISLVLVLPYMEQRLNTDKEYYESSFDEILIPIELADTHYKQSITACNRWMVDRADCLIAMVWRDHGGAYYNGTTASSPAADRHFRRQSAGFFYQRVFLPGGPASCAALQYGAGRRRGRVEFPCRPAGPA